MDKETFNAKQRERRLKTGNANTKKYEKTKNGFLMRAYRNMQSRVEGIQWRKQHLYSGKEIISREVFYDWSKSSPDFHTLFDEWEKSGYQRRITPSVDRIDSSIGYAIANMRWVPFHENCRNINRKKLSNQSE